MIPPIVVPISLTGVTDSVVERYRALFGSIDWSVLPERDPGRCWPGPKPNPPATFIKALLVKTIEDKPSIAALRRFLVEHPLLVLELGFRPAHALAHPLGFDVEQTVPSERWLRWQQQHIGEGVMPLLADSVHALHQHDPALDQVAAIDVTHHYAWVRQNNPNQTLTPRFRADRQPAGDPDCRLGGKKRHPTPNRSKTEAFWGYYSGVVSAPSALGDVVLAAHVQPVVAQDVSLFPPLAAQTEAVLGHPPVNLTADAAFDAWRVYEWVAQHGGMVAIPLNPRGGRPARSPEGHPCCAMNLVMTPSTITLHPHGYRVQNYRCPLRNVPDAHCPHPRFSRGGCTKRINIEQGGLHRLNVDRSSEAYRALYRHRTTAERIFSRLKHWGLDRPRARRLSTVTTILLIGYLAINLTVLATTTRSQTAFGGLAA